MKREKKKKRKIKKSNTIRISLTIFVIALAIYLIFNYPEKETKIEVESPSEIKQVITPGIPITTTIEKVKPTKFISDLKCVNGDIMMSFTNILRYPKDISDFSFFVAGRVNRNPDCELTHLEPGESTFCRNLNAGIKFRKKVLVAVGYPAHYEKAVVDCSKSVITTNIVRDLKEWFIKLFNPS